MEIRALTTTYAVSPQITPDDLAAVKSAGYVMVIDNRPDAEIPADLHTDPMRRAAQAAGLTFVANPVIGGQLTMQNVAAQAEAIAQATGPVLAYCASGNRSSIVWALAHAGKMPTDDLIGLPARHGYQLEGLRAQIDALATQS
ncbi:MAG: TIGR01244 family sulfur transferase [Paracoccaceae bacterium]|nr:TIGR01244 family sulfur transferase [Paracoccaceae bacterium]